MHRAQGALSKPTEEKCKHLGAGVQLRGRALASRAQGPRLEAQRCSKTMTRRHKPSGAEKTRNWDFTAVGVIGGTGYQGHLP